MSRLHSALTEGGDKSVIILGSYDRLTMLYQLIFEYGILDIY
jgi:hypothetical protein